MVSPPLLEASGLSLTFPGGVRALDGLSVSLQPGCHGLLGPNGAGKSTLIKVLLGLVRADDGSATVLGRDAIRDRREVRRRVGYMPERDAHVPGMQALDYVALMGRLSGLDRTTAFKRAHEVLHYVDLGEARARSLDGFSAGMKQRAKLAAALVHDPDLLFLDEPTNGLDPQGRRYMLDLIAELSREGISLVISTHLLPDVQEVCAEVVVVARGRVVRHGRVAELTQGLARGYILRTTGDPRPLLEALQAKGFDAEVDPSSGDLRVRAAEETSDPPMAILAAAELAGVGVKVLRPASRSLEEVFLESVGGAG